MKLNFQGQSDLLLKDENLISGEFLGDSNEHLCCSCSRENLNYLPDKGCWISKTNFNEDFGVCGNKKCLEKAEKDQNLE
jgi:hypothetical protein